MQQQPQTAREGHSCCHAPRQYAILKKKAEGEALRMTRIAIVEDEAAVREQLAGYVQRYTRQYGTQFEVTMFTDGVEILEDYRPVYAIIFLDAEMQHLAGMETARRIRELDSDVLLIFITNMAQYAIKGYAGGSLDYGLKPVGSSYLSNIVNAYATEIRASHSGSISPSPVIKIDTQGRFNLYLDYKVFMVPALMAQLLMMLCGFLPALNIVSEKEFGTIEQINVTPVSKFTFILAKLIPYWVAGMLILTISIILAWLVYGLVPAGHLWLLYFFALLFIIVISGMGLVVSNYSRTMQQAMFVMFFFVIIIMLMSGLFTPINSMPEWAQAITIANPLKYFIQVTRMVYLKGSGFDDLIMQFIALLFMAIMLNGWAVFSYKKNS